MRSSIPIAQVPIDPLSYNGVIDHIKKAIDENQKFHIVTVNPEMILNAQDDDDFYGILNKSSLNTADGVGVLWAAYYQSLPKKRGFKGFCQLVYSLSFILWRPSKIKDVIPERVTGTDLVAKIVSHSQVNGWRIFFLGASEGVAKKAMQSLKKIYPQAKLVGSFSGNPDVDSEQEICQLINESQADILFVAYGSPQQEYWIHRNLFKLNTVKVAIGVGGAFDFYANKIKRAPKSFRVLGLEWLWRLMMQPSRADRIKNATYEFVKLIYYREG